MSSTRHRPDPNGQDQLGPEDPATSITYILMASFAAAALVAWATKSGTSALLAAVYTATAPLVGILCGRLRGCAVFGAFIGFFLGPLGWLFILVGPDARSRCFRCLSVLPGATATVCAHCGVSLVQASPSTLKIRVQAAADLASIPEEEQST